MTELLVKRLRIVAKKYQAMILRLVEGVFDLQRGEEEPPRLTGPQIQGMVDPKSTVPIYLGDLVVGRLSWLGESSCNSIQQVLDILHRDVDRALVLCEGLYGLCNFFAVPYDEEDFYPLFRKSVLLAWAGKLEKFWKHQVCWIQARFLKDELPEKPSWFPDDKEGYLLGGPFRRFQTLYLHSGADKYASFVKSLLEIKRVSLDVAPDFVDAVLEEHRITLTRERKRPPKVVRTYTIYESLQETIKEVFPKKKKSKLGARVPSLRSHVESSRVMRGALGWIVAREKLVQSPCLLSMREGFDSRRGQVVEIWSQYDPEDIRAAFMKYYELGWDCDRLLSEPVALCEPFKVRVITKGPAGPYWVMKGLQLTLWRYLKSHPTFQLVGKPCSEQVVDEFLELCGPLDYFVSGDYKSATDNLDPDLTDYGFCYLAQRLGFWPTPQMRASLTGHELIYKKPIPFVQSAPQIWGQLMGSPLSFILLCLINVAASRLALDPTLSVPLRRLPIRVNGDDIIMGMSLEQYKLWKGVTAQCGLTYSVGKNYLSRKYLVINSEQYRVVRRKEHGQEVLLSRFVPYINLGLMKGLGKQVDDRRLFGAGEYVQDLSGLAQGLVRGWQVIPHFPKSRSNIKPLSDQKMADSLMSRFIQYNRDQLDKLPEGMSWFLPRCAGGYGLPITRDLEVSEQQLKVAAFVRTGQGALMLKHVEADPTLRSLSEEEDTIMESLGAQWKEGESGDPVSLMRVNWPTLSREASPDELLREVRTNFRSLRQKALGVKLTPMELQNALEEVHFGWSRSVNLNLPALKIGIV